MNSLKRPKSPVSFLAEGVGWCGERSINLSVTPRYAVSQMPSHTEHFLISAYARSRGFLASPSAPLAGLRQSGAVLRTELFPGLKPGASTKPRGARLEIPAPGRVECIPSLPR